MPDLLWEPQWSLFGFLSQVNMVTAGKRHVCTALQMLYRCCNINPVKVKTLLKSSQLIFKLQIATVKQVTKTTANHIQVYSIK